MPALTWQNLLLALALGYLVVTRAPGMLENFNREGTAFAEPIRLQTVEGALVSVPADRKLLVIVWATWCGPCEVELSRVAKLVEAGTLGRDDVLAVSTGEPAELVRQAVLERGYDFPVAADPLGLLAEALGLRGTPTSVLFAESGRIDWLSTGLSPSLEWRVRSFFSE